MKLSKNVLTDTMKKLDQIRERKARDSVEVEAKLISLRSEQAELQKELDQAAESMDLTRYEAISDKIKTVNTAIRMYEAKKDSLSSVTGISVEESDRTVDSLIAYEKVLSDQFIEDIAEPVAKLEKIIDEYDKNRKDLNETVRQWLSELNYKYRNGVSIPTMMGCSEAIAIRSFVNQQKEIQRLRKGGELK